MFFNHISSIWKIFVYILEIVYAQNDFPSEHHCKCLSPSAVKSCMIPQSDVYHTIIFTVNLFIIGESNEEYTKNSQTKLVSQNSEIIPYVSDTNSLLFYQYKSNIATPLVVQYIKSPALLKPLYYLLLLSVDF